jgi:flagellar motor protein MotB
MARRSSRPWPAFVDLFSALFITAFAGFVLLTGKSNVEVKKAKIRARVDTINTRLKKLLNEGGGVNFNAERQGDEIVFDLYIQFEKDSDNIKNEEDRRVVHKIAKRIKASINELPPDDREFVQVVIEGHTDSQQPYGIEDPKARYLFNWRLSSQRAASVLYEFKTAGLSPEKYSVISIGYADSRPRCKKDTPDCYRQNRRTSVRLRPDMARIETALRADTSQQREVSNGPPASPSN